MRFVIIIYNVKKYNDILLTHITYMMSKKV